MDNRGQYFSGPSGGSSRQSESDSSKGRNDHRDIRANGRERDTRVSDVRSRWEYGNDHRERPREYRDRRSTYGDSRGRFARDRLAYRQHDERRPRDGRKERVTDASANPDANLSTNEIISKYENRLISLLQVPTVDKLPIVGSQWGVKPKGFENVTAQRAKLSGLFPLPGSSRPVDVTKLEGSIKDGLTDGGILVASSKIDPSDSRNACIVIVEGVNFTKVDYMIITEYINNYLRSADLEGTALDNNIESSRKSKDNRKLIIELKSSTAATLSLALCGRVIGASVVGSDHDVVLHLKRPGEYVVQCLPPYDPKVEDVEDTVPESPRKITVLANKAIEESSLLSALSQIARLKAFKLVREIGTKESLGVVFVEFYLDSSKFRTTKSSIQQILSYLGAVKKLDMVKDAFMSCLTITNENKILTSIQDCPIELKTLKCLVRNEYVAYHPKSKVIQLINAVTATDLIDDETFEFIKKDILQEARVHGEVVSIEIPRPSKGSSTDFLSNSQTGVGKVYVEFEQENIALNALMSMAGRSYNDRTVLCAFFSHEDYLNGLY